MQASRDESEDSQKNTNKRPKSSSRFPIQTPSYIVAFAVHETYDDIATAQQMICNKRSLQGSTNSVSPALSSKAITIDRNSTQKMVDIDYSETKNETKINIDEGSAEGLKNEQVPNELLEIKDYLVVDEKGEEENETESKINLVESNTTFDVAKSTNKMNVIDGNNDDFEAIKTPKSYVNKLSKKRRQKQYRIKKVDFKYKKSLKKAENICKISAKLKETSYSDSLSKVVSRTSLLKNVPAKVNIIDTADPNVISDDENNKNESLLSSPSITNKSFLSYSSQDTLRQLNSTSTSRNEGMGSINSVTSVIKMPSETKSPYKTEIINVSVAVAYNPLKNNDVITKTSEPYRQMYDSDLMSIETLVQPAQMLTSESTSSDTSRNAENSYLQATNKVDDSDQTLRPKAMSDNTYVVGNSSDMDDSSTRSEDTLAPTSEMFKFLENLRPNVDKLEKDKKPNKPVLLDTVINMGIFPDINASTSSAVNLNKNLNNVFVTGDTSIFLTNPTFKRDQPLDNLKEEKYVLKKSFGAENDISLSKNLNLPDESIIKAIINDAKTENKFHSGEIANYPSSITELWDRLVKVVDSAVKRLENSLTDKIVDEIKKSLAVFELINQKIKDGITVVDLEQDKGDMVMSNNEESFEQDLKKEVDEMLQCDLVGNQIIDNIMMKLSVEGPTAVIPGTSSKSFQKMRPKIFRDYFEILKPPAADSAILEGKGDTITVSTAIPSELEEVQSVNRIKSLLSAPVACVRENMFVISSVPAFFIVMLLMYGFFVLILKPW